MMTKKQSLLYSLLIFSISGFIYSIIPFIKSMKPTQGTINESILNINISDIKPGSYKYVNWKYAPLIVYRPGKDSIQTLESYNNIVFGPSISSDNIDELYVYKKISTFRGCPLSDIKEHYESENLPEGWFDMCHMGSWDFTGRAFRKYFAPDNTRLPNLEAVKYSTLNDDTIQIQKQF